MRRKNAPGVVKKNHRGFAVLMTGSMQNKCFFTHGQNWNKKKNESYNKIIYGKK